MAEESVKPIAIRMLQDVHYYAKQAALLQRQSLSDWVTAAILAKLQSDNPDLLQKLVEENQVFFNKLKQDNPELHKLLSDVSSLAQ
ncbi:MAG: hypothetical protein ACE5Q6_09185 [Dehalococcoidia bacterium]